MSHQEQITVGEQACSLSALQSFWSYFVQKKLQIPWMRLLLERPLIIIYGFVCYKEADAMRALKAEAITLY